MPESRLSLRGRLVGVMALVFLGGTVALYWAAGMYAQTAADRSYDRLLAGSALSIVETLSITNHEVQVDLPYAALDMLSAAPDDRVFYRIIGPDAQTITGYDDLPTMPSSGADAEKAASGLSRFFDAKYRGEAVRFVLLGREIAEPGVSGWIWVQVGQTRRARDELANELMLNALLPIGPLTVISIALVWFGVGRALRPLGRVGEDLLSRGPSELHAVRSPVPTEIVPLVDAINAFMRRLGGVMGTLRVFIAEAAHQMRTPLAALRAQAQLAMDDEPEDLRRSLQAIERNASKLSRLLDQLLADATVIHRSDLRRFESFDLIEMTNKSIRQAVPITGNTEVRFSTQLTKAPFTGDELMLREAIKNVIDNALRHGQAEGEVIDIELGALDEDYVLDISDRGPGIPLDLREKVFERFARGETQVSGAGLGLAIVKQVVESHHGSITLLDREGGGLTMRLQFPRSAS
jgi:two-component system sensor histidine kinase TctE